MGDRPDITIPEEARVAGWDAFRAGIDLQLTGPQVFVRALEAAAPLIVAAELERQARDLDEQAEAFGVPKMGTPASGMVTVLSELAEELRARAAELRGGTQ